METRRSNLVMIFALLAVNMAIGEALSSTYYWNTCPNVEVIVRQAVEKKINQTVVTIPATLRLFFHDCMVTGCDASTLIALTNAEKDAPDNLSLAGDGFDTVIQAKAAVEEKCKGVVSCADILALASRDVVALSGGPDFPVELGRYDGLVSNASLVAGHLPSPDNHLDDLITLFAANGFNITDLIALSGAHTCGFSHCDRFQDRLFNYTGQPGLVDPTMNSNYSGELQVACPLNVDATIAVNMDPITSITFDNMYYKNLINGLGLFTSDQILYGDSRSTDIVKEFADNQDSFFDSFSEAMKKLGRLNVKTSANGEIRKDCTAFNH